jgi:hypothetical protein
MDQWDAFADTASRSLSALGFEPDNVSVYEPQITPAAGSGFEVSYPATATTTVQAGIEPPTAAADRDEAGTDTDVDVVLLVDEDAGPQWTGYGESGAGSVDAAAIVELPSGFRALVTDYEPQGDGFDRLACTETDR